MVKADVTPRSIDYRKSYTLRFINKGIGTNLRPNK
jgi:NitT/TauT family transport system substrate-binding protein